MAGRQRCMVNSGSMQAGQNAALAAGHCQLTATKALHSQIDPSNSLPPRVLQTGGARLAAAASISPPAPSGGGRVPAAPRRHCREWQTHRKAR